MSWWSEQEALAIRGERHEAGGPHEEPRSEQVLQPPDLAADGLLGDREAFGGSREAQFLGDRDERA